MILYELLKTAVRIFPGSRLRSLANTKYEYVCILLPKDKNAKLSSFTGQGWRLN